MPSDTRSPTQSLTPSVDRLFSESAFRVLNAANALVAKGHDVINLGIGQPDFKTPHAIAEAGVKAIRDGHHGYTPSDGIAPLRQAVIDDYLRRYPTMPDQDGLSPNNVLVVPGGKVTMFIAITMLGQPGKEIMYPDPGFPMYQSIAQFSGATPVPMPMRHSNNFDLDLDEIESLLSDRTSLVILNTPHNPTGKVITKEQIERLVTLLEPYPNCFLMADEIYAECVFDGASHHSLLMEERIRPRLIVLDGVSKRYAMTGWRLGYALWPDALIDKAKTMAVNMHSCVNAPAQYAAIEALAYTHPEEAVIRQTFQQRAHDAAAALNAIDGIECNPAQGAFYLFPQVQGDTAAIEKQWLEQHHVATIAGHGFGQHCLEQIRFSVANDRVVEAIKRLPNL
ncbi:MAG: aminotransferase class I/II-fold pyridoxal phosphate-dependent enzyme [Alphaproteobacteria bacterium]|nr:aminotransferase class I/II-fold pyridoxal phosphate-dependent enzyme [Alphaproteobacteria bacterium]